MKRFFYLLITVLALSSFTGPTASIEWEFTEHDFGELEKGKPVSIEFTFTNPSMIPLVITDVKSSCGCTVPEYPKAPVSPGGEGKVLVTYDAKTSGYFNKTITVKSNTADGVSLLYIKGEVKE